MFDLVLIDSITSYESDYIKIHQVHLFTCRILLVFDVHCSGDRPAFWCWCQWFANQGEPHLRFRVVVLWFVTDISSSCFRSGQPWRLSVTNLSSPMKSGDDEGLQQARFCKVKLLFGWICMNVGLSSHSGSFDMHSLQEPSLASKLFSTESTKL